MMEVAATCLGGLDILEERVAGHDERVELLARVLEAAGRSTLEAKVRALGRVLADGLREGELLDEAFMLAAALDELEAAHILVLQFIAAAHPPSETGDGSKQPATRGWETDALVQELPDIAVVVEPAVAVLARHGLLSASGGRNFPGHVGPAIYRISPLGTRCLFLLRDDEVQQHTPQ
jgi:hypothetical protein